MIEDYEGLTKRVDNLEYKDIAPLKEDVNNLKINIAENNILTKQAIETNSKLTDTISCLKESLIQMGESMKASNKVSEELAENVKTLSNQFVTLDKKVDDKFYEVDEKSKVDILTWCKNNWLSLFLTLGAVIYIIAEFENIK